MSEKIEKTLKPGKFSTKDMKYISQAYETMSPEDIAETLNRSVDAIKEKIAQLPKRQQLSEGLDVISQLHASPMWGEIKKTLRVEQYEFFESQWASFVRQFSNGTEILASDEMMIKDLIMLDIAATRAESELNEARMVVDQLQKLINKEMMKSVEVRDMMTIEHMRAELLAYKSSIPSLSKMQLEYQKSKDSKLEDLKATRKARAIETQESTKTFWGLLSALNETNSRVKDGKRMEKLRIAADRVRKDYNQVIEFDDGELDKPFVSPEGELEDLENNTNQGEQDDDQFSDGQE